jgi:hypothetical protein
MAGGPFAEVVACLERWKRAERVYEGSEDDHYLCEDGHPFGIDWSRGMPTEPCWPTSDEDREAFERLRRERDEK